MISTELFNYNFKFTSGVDIGVRRDSNQDIIICCPENGFFAVSDGMGGLAGGSETSEMIAKTLPLLISEAYKELIRNPLAEYAAELLYEQVRLISDIIFDTLNESNCKAAYGATLCAVWFIGDYAVLINIGDSRCYLLSNRKGRIKQITNDHNVAAALVENGELTIKEARNHKSSHSLTRFVGMEKPAQPDIFIQKINDGDKLLLCSDGLYGMIEDVTLSKLMCSSDSGNVIIEHMINAANLAGGYDNISAIYIEMMTKTEV